MQKRLCVDQKSCSRFAKKGAVRVNCSGLNRLTINLNWSIQVSQLIQKLKIAARLEASPLGFSGVNKAAVKPTPVIVARVSGDEKQASSLVAGADAVFIDTFQEEVAARFIKQLTKEDMKMPYGCWLGNNSGSMNDFYALDLDADMSQLKNNKAGKALVISPDIEDKFLRQLDDLPVDAIVVEEKGSLSCRLTIKNYMQCHRLAIAVSKPLLLHIDSKVTAQDVEEMWSYGIDGFVVDIDPAFPSAIQDLVKMIDSIDLDLRRKKISLTPIIPSVRIYNNQDNETSPDEDGDDDDYDE